MSARLAEPLADPCALDTGMPKANNVLAQLHQARTYLEQRVGLRFQRSIVSSFEHSSKYIMQARYEDLSSEPAKQPRRICEFPGIEFEESMLDFSSHVHHTTNGNDMRFVSGTGIVPDIYWSRELPEADRQNIEQQAGQLSREFGYQR